MLVTISWMSKNYNKYNNLYFGGKLPNIEFKINKSKKTWGYAEYTFSRSKNTVTPRSITLSNYYDAPEDVKLTTLLHEMIHIADYTLNPHHFVRNGRRCHYDAHGWWFKNEAARLKKYGWDIEKYVTAEEKSQASLTSRSAALEKNKEDNALLCVIVGTNGYNWMVKTSRSNVENVLLTIQNCRWNLTLGSVKDINFYTFDNPSIAQMRSCNKKLRGWKYNYVNLMNTLEKYKATEVHFDKSVNIIKKRLGIAC